MKTQDSDSKEMRERWPPLDSQILGVGLRNKFGKAEEEVERKISRFDAQGQSKQVSQPRLGTWKPGT